LSGKKGLQKGGAGAQQMLPNKYIDIRCQDLGRNNTFTSATQFAQEAKTILENDPTLLEIIQKIEINDEFLRIHLTKKGQENAAFVRTKAAGIFGCRARMIENTYKNNKFTPPNPNFSKTWDGVR
jgi:hypothetical protein